MRNWIFILIFSTLLGNMNAHQVQLVTYHEKTNGILIRIVVSNAPDVNNITGTQCDIYCYSAVKMF